MQYGGAISPIARSVTEDHFHAVRYGAENVSVLSAAKDAGIELPHDCELGVCLTCPAKVISGKVDHSGSTLDDSVSEQGYALTCCTFPRSDVTIRSIDEDELVSAQFGREIEKKLQ